jgi:hypothetical protein
MKTKRKKNKTLNFTTANEKLVFDIIRSIVELKNMIPFLKIKISSK